MTATPLGGWENFYVILGSSAGALIGLQFVVVTLIAEMPKHPDIEQAGAAFATPTVVHFAVVLVLSALATIPWQGPHAISVLWAIIGIIGFVYCVVTVRRMTLQKAYKPVLEDWLFFWLFPKTAYLALLVSAFLAHTHLRGSEFGVAAAALVLLLVGIHNAWDSVMYQVMVQMKKEPKDPTSQPR